MMYKLSKFNFLAKLCLPKFYYSTTTAKVKSVFENGVQTITMCDVKTRNILSIAVMEDLLMNIKRYRNDLNLRVIILAAEGNVFSAGHNMQELHPEVGQRQHLKVFHKCSELMMSIIDSPVPVIAKVDGLAAAAGCQLVAQCDLAICTDTSKFSTPGANFGIFCSTPGIPLARCVQKKTALHMLFTGLPITAQEARQCGLISVICTRDEFDKELKQITSAIIDKSRAVIELGKRFYYKQVQCGIKEAYEMGSITMVNNINLKDGQEGIKAFISKKKPYWVHSFD